MSGRKPVRWAPAALNDLELTCEYLRERNPAGARRFANRILDLASLLRAHPEIGPVARDIEPVGRYRHLVAGRYRIIYRVADDFVWVLRVWDTRRNPDDLIVGGTP